MVMKPVAVLSTFQQRNFSNKYIPYAVPGLVKLLITSLNFIITNKFKMVRPQNLVQPLAYYTFVQKSRKSGKLTMEIDYAKLSLNDEDIEKWLLSFTGFVALTR